jgi:anti-anti-sigma factor
MTDPSSDLRLLVVNTAAQTRLEVGGELDVGTVGPLRDHLDALIDDGIGAVHVDMSLVTFCDSTTLSVLACAFTRLREAHRPLRVIILPPRWPECSSCPVSTRSSSTATSRQAERDENTHFSRHTIGRMSDRVTASWPVARDPGDTAQGAHIGG